MTLRDLLVPLLSLFIAAPSPHQGAGFLLPPEAYQGDRSVAVSFGDRLVIEQVCTRLVGRPAIACANPSMMYVENPCDLTGEHWYIDLLCHELGHTNGWPGDHPS